MRTNFKLPKVRNYKRSFIEISYIGSPKRERVYNGSIIGLHIYPNRQKGTERLRQLEILRDELTTCMMKGWKPSDGNYERVQDNVLISVLNSVLLRVKQSYGRQHIDSLNLTLGRFKKFLTSKQMTVSALTITHIRSFLDTFDSPTKYNRNRKHLSILLNKANIHLITPKSIPKLKERKEIPTPFTEDELITLLNWLKLEDYELYLCAKVMYFTLLRPHQEIRKLKILYITQTHISVPKGFTKNGKGRKIPINKELANELLKFTYNVPGALNLWSQMPKHYDRNYFLQKWKRLKPLMLEKHLIKDNQKLYSVRHSAAVALYNKTQNLQLVSTVMDHSSIRITMDYLKTLNVHMDNLKIEDMPTL